MRDYLVFGLPLSSNCIVFDFPFRIHLYGQCIRHFFLSPHIQGILGHMDFWESTSISKILYMTREEMKRLFSSKRQFIQVMGSPRSEGQQ